MNDQLDFSTLLAPVTVDAQSIDMPLVYFKENFGDELGFSPRLSQHLVNSIRNLGILVPVLIGNNEGKLSLLAGRRRILAAEAAGVEAIPTRYLNVNDFSAALVTLDENNARSENVLSDLEAINIVIGMGKAQGKLLAPKEIARLTGMPLVRVQRRLKLLTMPDEFVQALHDGKIGAHLAERISKAPKARQQALVSRLYEKGNVNAHDLDEINRTSAHVELERLIPWDALAEQPQAPEPEGPPIYGTLEIKTDVEWKVLINTVAREFHVLQKREEKKGPLNNIDQVIIENLQALLDRLRLVQH